MPCEFDKTISRRGSGALKYDNLKALYGREDLLPLWIADMDFPTPAFIREALMQRLQHPVLGYGTMPERLWPTVAQWIAAHHGWNVQAEWLTYVPGIVRGIGMAVNALTRPGDKIIIQPPVYPPFRHVPEENGREVVFNPLKEKENGGYEMDLDHLESLLSDDRVKIFILCNPHNPAGIVWEADVLRRVATLCHRAGITVISDEIHCDLALFGHRHTPFASISSEAADCSITFQAPSKTFNMAGLAFSYAVVPSPVLRKKLFTWLMANEFCQPTILSPLAAIAAYSQGESWRREMLAYVEQNVLFVEEYCRAHLPLLHPWRPQASFLVWLDCRKLGLSQPQLVDFFVNKAHLALNDGITFGPGGEGFMRLNVGEPRCVIRQALQQLETAFSESR